ncbi:5-formyltetrahydrofolate cyclo-ligase [Nitrosospira sp. Nsp2]|uniref:5-formyltetrahydrofolate cyclo-ligase n=1 Tax=Nitrosospira sp. Nsp2 TaxID=136548 RepID=UPI000D315A43|nr:5-formyltetrahydrofolate cyclo-ligase [Nitrosospira sp. Nsp2]PTR14444.1 5-formyltetrahydrofolate cyclo-ligase [Nitrosospira sp. Nsp2]
MDNWREWRREKRAELIKLRGSISREEYRDWSAAITGLLKKGFPSLQNSVVGFCWPHRGEYDPRPLMDFITEGGATLALPEVVNKHEPLDFRKWWRDAPMKIGAYDIPVPDNTDPVTVRAMVIPMIGFDKQGFRLGYGSGYFDRTLVAIRPRPLAIGVAFEILRVDTLHPQPHDVPMDFIVTEAGIYRSTINGLELISAETSAAESVRGSEQSGR